MPKEIVVCESCGSTKIDMEVYATWDIETQQWEVDWGDWGSYGDAH